MPSRKPLPPDPPMDSSGPAPPLPSRTGMRALPSVPNGSYRPPYRKRPPEYTETDEWVTDNAPVLPPRNFSPSPEPEGEAYEVPDLQPPARGRAAPPPIAPPSSDDQGDVYDELEGIVEDKKSPLLPPPPQEIQGEIYDQCDIQEQTQTEGGDLYEDPEINPPIIQEGGMIYEVPDETNQPPVPSISKLPSTPRPPPPPTTLSPPQPPATDTLPGPLPTRSTGQTATNKLQAIKKISGDGPANLGISMDMLGAKKANLRKVSTEREPEKTSEQDAPLGDKASVQDKISLFTSSGSKPVIKPKPNSTIYKPTAAVNPSARAESQTTSKSPVNKTTPAPPPSKTPPPVVQSYTEDIYDDALTILPPKDPLSDEIWYHGERERQHCEKDLTTNGEDGSYLVRKSSKGGDSQPYTLVVLYKGHVYNLRIRMRADGKIALGNEKDEKDELAFDDVPDLICHHTTNEVILVHKQENKQYRALLKSPLRFT